MSGEEGVVWVGVGKDEKAGGGLMKEESFELYRNNNPSLHVAPGGAAGGQTEARRRLALSYPWARFSQENWRVHGWV